VAARAGLEREGLEGGERGRAGVAAAGEGNGGERRTFSVWRRGVGGRLRVHDVPQLLPPTSGPIAPWDPTFSLVGGGTLGVAARGRERPALARSPPSCNVSTRGGLKEPGKRGRASKQGQPLRTLMSGLMGGAMEALCLSCRRCV
jgi:hypothetical protein